MEGADECEECGQPLTDLHLPMPASDVELSLLTDRLHGYTSRRPIVISPTMPIREVLRLLVDNRIGCLLVVEKGKLVGIFTERDVLMKLNDRAVQLGDRPVSEFMTSSVQALPATAKIAFALHRMDLGGYRHVPIVDDEGRPIGIFSIRDMLSYLTRKMAG
jgi:CBS domain-containing protein